MQMAPRVSVIMANWNGAAHLAAALASLRRQTLTDWEVIVSDDGSHDGSVGIVQGIAAADARVRLVQSGQATGPAAARNRALDVATGDWIAILDSDDLMHPTRLARLLAAAAHMQADIIADDMLFFGARPGSGGRTLLQPLALSAPMVVDAALWVRSGADTPGLPPLGYLKPLIRRTTLAGLRYDPSLRVGEDFDLILRLLVRGARFAVVPDPMYLYRRHGASISHRLSLPVVRAMIAAQAGLPPQSGPVATALAQRRRGLVRLADYEALVAAIKARQTGRALAALVRRPGLAAMLARSLRERLARPAHPPGPAAGDLALLLAAPGTPAPEDGMVLHLPHPPEPGLAWPVPPAPIAARLTALSERHHLRPRPADAAGEWAMWLVPPVADTA